MNNTNSNLYLHSYLSLRKAIGIIGFSLPWVLLLGGYLLEGKGAADSISAYYYTLMRDVFVGSLCMVGVFLGFYKGYEKKDDRVGNIAGLAVFGVAFFPISMELNPSFNQQLIEYVHYFSALVFFVCLAYFSLFLFPKTCGSKPMTAKKITRNKLYIFSGGTILFCLFWIILIVLFYDGTELMDFQPIFYLESIALMAFGIAWLVKGKAFLCDRHP